MMASESFCSRRNRERELLHGMLRSRGVLPASREQDVSLERARAILDSAGDIFVTGRIHSIETARASVQFVEQVHASLDLWDSEAAFDTVQAIQRSGFYGVSLAEARESTTLLIVVGDDSLLEEYPRIPAALSAGRRVRTLLLGSWSEESIQAWRRVGFDALAIDCDVQGVPRSLLQSARSAASWPWESQVGDWLQQASFTTVLWSNRNLQVAHGDLWIESMMAWIANRNSDRRCAALAWGGLDVGFQQACTWLTGFPGRIRYRKGVVEYDPTGCRAKVWLQNAAAREPIENRLSNGPKLHGGASMGGNPTGTPNTVRKPVLVWVDDTADSIPPPVLSSGVPMIVVSPSGLSGTASTTIQHEIVWLPTLLPGIEVPSEFFRGDQTLMVRGIQEERFIATDFIIGDAPTMVAGDWLRRLVAR
ncbi:MAG: hypothetical protein ACK5PZ_21315 [Pirellula sp.]